MGYYRKMPENVEGLQIAGKKFYKAAEGAALYSMGIVIIMSFTDGSR